MNWNKLIKRIIQIVIILFGVSFVIFALMFIAPGDPVLGMYQSSGEIPSQEVLDATREAMGLNKPFIVQYFTWLSGVLHLSFGDSYLFHRPVMEIIGERLGPTIMLAVFSLALMLAIAIPLGVVAALNKNKWQDYLIRGFSFIGISFPSFCIGLLLIYIFAMQMGWFPVVSRDTGFLSMILPAVTLAIPMSSKYTRQVRAAVLEELDKDYVIGLTMRGMSKAGIIWKHIIPNAFLPLLTLIGLSFGSLLAGTTVVETVFSYQGLGNMAVQAIMGRDYPLVQGYVMWVAVIYMVVNLVVDILYGRLDPRIRKEEADERG